MHSSERCVIQDKRVFEENSTGAKKALHPCEALDEEATQQAQKCEAYDKPEVNPSHKGFHKQHNKHTRFRPNQRQEKVNNL